MLKKKRTWIILGVVAALIGGGIYLATRSSGQASASQLLADAQTATVVQTTLFTSVDSTGSIIPEAQLDLSFATSGTVDEVKVAVGDQVKKGDVLATLDTTDLERKVTEAEQSYLLQQLTYSETVQADPSDVAIARASYNSALASYNAARQDYNNLADKEAVQCSSLTSTKASLERAQIAYDRLPNDRQASQHLSGDWGPFQNVVDGLTNAIGL
jgi:multidrug efflux pump subunit AcrA (membrane-fusion protein)